jgi:hypothetical protein
LSKQLVVPDFAPHDSSAYSSEMMVKHPLVNDAVSELMHELDTESAAADATDSTDTSASTLPVVLGECKKIPVDGRSKQLGCVGLLFMLFGHWLTCRMHVLSLYATLSDSCAAVLCLAPSTCVAGRCELSAVGNHNEEQHCATGSHWDSSGGECKPDKCPQQQDR